MKNEQLYRKVGKKYLPVDYVDRTELSDGVWLIQTKSFSKSFTSLAWKLGDLKRPVDVATQSAILALNDIIAQYLVELSDENSEEFKALEASGILKKAPQFFNISASDFAFLILKRLAEEFEDTDPINLVSLSLKFRESVSLHTQPNFDEKVSLLYSFIEFLEKNNIKIIKKH